MSTPAETKSHPPGERPATPRTRLARLELAAVLTVVAGLALLTAGILGYGLAGRGTPADDSPEAGFARDMQTHHNQAVAMALLIRDRTRDPTLRAVSYDIIVSQQQQSGQMFGWLSQWRLPQTASQPPMAWMNRAPSMSGMPMNGATGSTSSLVDGRMPGMASPADLARLKDATGRQAEMLFLRLMIAHHQGGITMARAIQPLTDRPEVKTLARAIQTAQTAEIDQMEQLLAKLGTP